jgi:hypothetical protein
VIGRAVTAGIPSRPRAFASVTAFKSISPTSQAGLLANEAMAFRVAIWLHDRIRQATVGHAECGTNRSGLVAVTAQHRARSASSEDVRDNSCYPWGRSYAACSFASLLRHPANEDRRAISRRPGSVMLLMRQAAHRLHAHHRHRSRLPKLNDPADYSADSALLCASETYCQPQRA